MREIPRYNPAEIEPRWRAHWDDIEAFKVRKDHTMPKYFPLVEFPYPSGVGLHVGHPRPYIGMDVIARKRRMEGYNVLFPIGYDAFGLPAENYAIKHGVHPSIVTRQNINRYREQLKSMSLSFDYDREVNTTDPKYYKWTQWIFLKLYERGLAYKTEMPINWCPSCKIGLANEEVVGGHCERCGGEVVRRVKSQWMLKITAYAQRLLDGLDDLDFIEKVKVQQRNWIGRSEGAEVDFTLDIGGARSEKLRVFTTRPDTLFGVTYMVISPEHPLIDKHRAELANYAEVVAYRETAARKSDFERTELNKDKTGVRLDGITAINPVNGQAIPVYASDYVLMSYGTGAIMAVPGHDTRDWDFAKAFGIPIIQVISGPDVQDAPNVDTENGLAMNSGFIDGMKCEEAKKAMIDWLVEKGIGERKVNFKLRDWVFSRQRYWGEPIPLVHCEHCGWVPVPEDQLPLTLPEVEKYEPTDNGESPLAAITDWVKTTCPKCGGPAERETDTMPQWAGSSWYFMRYVDPHNDDMLGDPEELKYWLPVDWYNGGMEHTTLHLLYSRFWYQALYDIGVAPTPEPYRKRTSHGFILGANGEKMSKSRGNVVNPDDIIAQLGADAFRVYEMFIGAFDQAIPWSTDGALGCRRFLDRVWRLMEILTDEKGVSADMACDVNSCIKKVGEDYERMKYNTAIAAMMALVNAFYQKGSVTRGELKALILILNPVAPHICEEINRLCSLTGELVREPWPRFDPAALVLDTVEIAVQVNGKVRGRVRVPSSLKREEAESYFADTPEALEIAGGPGYKKLVYVPGRLVNIVR